MKLSGKEILSRVEARSIVIEPFDPAFLNPNSYDLRLGEKLLVYTDVCLDAGRELPTEEYVIPAGGFILQPGELYLGATQEYTETPDLIPGIEGRSSVGRLGINVHATAGFGDVGFCGTWTLEISVIKPIRVYAGMRICQIYFERVQGDYEKYSSAKYQGQKDPRPSGIWRERDAWK